MCASTCVRSKQKRNKIVNRTKRYGTNKTKRNETRQIKIKAHERNVPRQDETKQHETKRNATQRNELDSERKRKQNAPSNPEQK